MTITAQDLYNYTKCEHRVFLDANGDPAERGEVSSFVQMLWEMGLQTERAYLDQLEGFDWENLEALSLDEAAERTLEMMRSGVEVIYQGVVKHDDLVGRPDILLRVDRHESRFGSWCYEPIDIKAGSGWEKNDKGEPTKFKKQYAFQVMFYRHVLERIQGVALPVGRIVNVDFEYESFECAAFEDEFACALSEATALASGVEQSEPVISSGCAQCAWSKKCKRWAEKQHDPTLLFFVGKNKFQLKQAGLQTVEDIAKINVEHFLEPENKIRGLGKKSLERMKRRAQVWIAGKPEIRSGYSFPEGRKEIYFDIEDDPTRDHTYLYGLIETDASGEFEYRYFLAEKPEDEEQAVREFWDYLAANDTAVYYVYSPKERSSLKRLMRRYALDESVFKKYEENEYDLYHGLVMKYSDWPTSSYGIKNIAKQVGFNWRDSDPGGANSIVWYNDYLSDPSNTDLLNRILEYNEDDCYAMIAVKEYFEAEIRSDRHSAP